MFLFNLLPALAAISFPGCPTVSKGRDLQLEKAVEETLKLLQKEPWPTVKNPPYSTPGKKK